MNNMTQPIRGKIARVLNSREVAINKGADDGVKIGMTFKILSTKGSEIKDPDTGEPLGSVDLVKDQRQSNNRARANRCCITFRSRRVNVGGHGFGIGGMFEPPKWETRIETLLIDDAAIKDLDEEDAIVQTGDPVVQDLEIVPTDTEAPN